MGKIPAINLGERLTRISRTHIESMFVAIAAPEKPKEQQPARLQYEPHECYTIKEIAEKFEVTRDTVCRAIRRYSIPQRQIGNSVYVPKEEIDRIFANKKSKT
ncbi:hypothetical protein AGMMS49525_05790 [Bacteroidia bacterium]|nr:hypothetical protein AGMMS49525_05790 [Bacteroidia bacterium]